jgi:hypothetical protein
MVGILAPSGVPVLMSLAAQCVLRRSVGRASMTTPGGSSTTLWLCLLVPVLGAPVSLIRSEFLRNHPLRGSGLYTALWARFLVPLLGAAFALRPLRVARDLG